MPSAKKAAKKKAGARRKPSAKFLGEIFTEIAGMQYYEAALKPGGKLHLEREPDNQHDRNAIRVMNSKFRQAGYIPRRISSWLSPLIDSGEVWVEGHLADSASDGYGKAYMLIELYLYGKGRDILRRRIDPPDELEAVHQAVLAVWSDIEKWTYPDAVKGLGRRLAGLAGDELLPKTQMLLQLFKYRAWALRRKYGDRVIEGVRDSLKKTRIGKALYYHNLTIFPLISENGHKPEYMLLEEAIKKKLAEVREVSEEGSVPELLIDNRAPMPLLIPEGEVLIGAKQDRTINITIIIMKMTRHVINVSCVEQGRWSGKARGFAASHFATPGLRARKIQSSQENRRRSGEAVSDQSQVWRDVADSISEVNAVSETGTITDAYKASNDRIKKYQEKLVLPKDASGVIVASGEDIIGMDLYDSPKTMRRIWPRLSESYFFEAATREKKKKTLRSAPRSFIEALPPIIRLAEKPSGQSQEIEFSGDEYAGSGVWYNGRLCHLSAFRTRNA